jgi:hypothetical protein
MSLLSEILDGAVKSDYPISDLLRRAALLGAQLQNDELQSWAFLELKGYKGAAVVPDYRILPAHATGHFSGPFGQEIRNFTIPASLLPENLKDFAGRVILRHPIAEIDSMSVGDEKHGYLSCPWPGDLVRLMQGEVFEGMALMGAEQKVPKASLKSIVDSVRNRLLEFVMKIKAEDPNADDPDIKSIPGDRVHQIIQTTIYGNVSGDLIAGVGGSVTVIKDVNALKENLRGMGIPEEDVLELETSIAEDKKETAGMGSKVAAWIASIGQKAKTGTVKLTQGVTVDVIVKLIMAYYAAHAGGGAGPQ